jgi:hypothetical protein
LRVNSVAFVNVKPSAEGMGNPVPNNTFNIGTITSSSVTPAKRERRLTLIGPTFVEFNVKFDDIYLNDKE